MVLEAFRTGQPVPAQMAEAMDEITQRVVQRKARILMDAEQHVFLGGIFELTLNLMRKYNRNGEAVVYNTYQAYLKTTPDNIAAHMHLASTEGFVLGLKLVRGAYMSSDPRYLIHDSKSETDTAYDHIVQSVLRKQFRNFGGETGDRPFPPTDLFLATHNKRSAVAAHHLHQSRLKEQLPTIKVEFGQLMGMADSVSYGMLQLKSNNNIPPGVFKCLHWGTMGECLGFMVRRAMENQDAVSRTDAEHKALKAELKRRVMG